MAGAIVPHETDVNLTNITNMHFHGRSIRGASLRSRGLAV
jgi:hypothetical protein